MSASILKVIIRSVQKIFTENMQITHDFMHLKRVNSNAKKIVKLLHYERFVDINLLSALCYLHDITWTKYRFSAFTYMFEGILAQPITKSLLESSGVNSHDKKIIQHAIRFHPHSIPFHILNRKNDVYTQILQDADSLDYFELSRVNEFISKLPPQLKKITTFGAQFLRNHIYWFLNYPENATLITSKPNKNYMIWNFKKNNTILCLHGYADTHRMFKIFSELMPNYKIIALDLPQVHMISRSFTLDEIVNYIEQKRIELKITKCTLVGFSFGGLVATKYASAFPERVNHLILLNSVPDMMVYPIIRKILERSLPIITARPFLFVCKHLQRIFHKSHASNSFENTVQTNAYQAVLKTTFKGISQYLLQIFNKLPMKKTVIIFKDDTVLPYSFIKPVLKTLNANIHICSSGGHAQKPSYWDHVVSNIG